MKAVCLVSCLAVLYGVTPTVSSKTSLSCPLGELGTPKGNALLETLPSSMKMCEGDPKFPTVTTTTTSTTTTTTTNTTTTITTTTTNTTTTATTTTTNTTRTTTTTTTTTNTTTTSTTTTTNTSSTSTSTSTNTSSTSTTTSTNTSSTSTSTSTNTSSTSTTTTTNTSTTSTSTTTNTSTTTSSTSTNTTTASTTTTNTTTTTTTITNTTSTTTNTTTSSSSTTNTSTSTTTNTSTTSTSTTTNTSTTSTSTTTNTSTTSTSTSTNTSTTSTSTSTNTSSTSTSTSTNTSTTSTSTSTNTSSTSTTTTTNTTIKATTITTRKPTPPPPPPGTTTPAPPPPGTTKGTGCPSTSCAAIPLAPYCGRASAGGSPLTCKNFTNLFLAYPCLSTPLMFQCPKNNTNATRIPDMITSKGVLCRPCGFEASVDRHPGKGDFWVTLKWGPLWKEGNVEYGVSGYTVFLLGADGRRLHHLQYVAKGQDLKESCCRKDKYSLNVEGKLPEELQEKGEFSFEIVATEMKGGQRYYLPQGVVTSVITDNIDGVVVEVIATVTVVIKGDFEKLPESEKKKVKLALAESIAAGLEGVEKENVIIISITKKTSRLLRESSKRRLSQDTAMDVEFKILAPDSVGSIDATSFDASSGFAAKMSAQLATSLKNSGVQGIEVDPKTAVQTVSGIKTEAKGTPANDGGDDGAPPAAQLGVLAALTAAVAFLVHAHD